MFWKAFINLMMKPHFVNRTRVVSVNGKLPNAAELNCGVPKGSILEPLLFLFFINDLPLILSDNIYSTDLFADDATIYDMQGDLETLQRNLQHSFVSLQVWGKRKGMLLNTDKTKLMLIRTRQKRARLDTNLFTLTYNDVDLQLTTGDILNRIYYGIIIFNVQIEKYHLIFGCCQKLNHT